MALNPRRDFRDDGGTRAWRANQATYLVLDAPAPGLRGWFLRIPLVQWLLKSSPAKILIVGLLVTIPGMFVAFWAALLLAYLLIP